MLTSLVDVMFVLLFFFMLASSYLDWGALDVHLGGSRPAHAAPLPATRNLLLCVDGSLQLDGKLLAPSTLTAALGADARVILRPQQGVSLQQMISVIDQLKAAGATLTLAQAPP